MKGVSTPGVGHDDHLLEEFREASRSNSPGVPQWQAYNSTTEDYESLVPPMPTLNDTFATGHVCLDLLDKI